MWDRETESLWWPLIGRAVSGTMKGTNMKVMDESLWQQTTWEEVMKNYPNALVLKSDQDFERPTSWHRRYDSLEKPDQQADGVAPKWGENATIDQ